MSHTLGMYPRQAFEATKMEYNALTECHTSLSHFALWASHQPRVWAEQGVTM